MIMINDDQGEDVLTRIHQDINGLIQTDGNFPNLWFALRRTEGGGLKICSRGGLRKLYDHDR